MAGYVCGADGKFVAAHGMHQPQAILARNGVRNAGSASPKQIFCASNNGTAGRRVIM